MTWWTHCHCEGGFIEWCPSNVSTSIIYSSNLFQIHCNYVHVERFTKLTNRVMPCRICIVPSTWLWQVIPFCHGIFLFLTVRKWALSLTGGIGTCKGGCIALKGGCIGTKGHCPMNGGIGKAMTGGGTARASWFKLALSALTGEVSNSLAMSTAGCLWIFSINNNVRKYYENKCQAGTLEGSLLLALAS